MIKTYRVRDKDGATLGVAELDLSSLVIPQLIEHGFLDPNVDRTKFFVMPVSDNLAIIQYESSVLYVLYALGKDEQ